MSKSTPSWLQEIRDYWSQLVEDRDSRTEAQTATGETVTQDFGDSEGLAVQAMRRELEVMGAEAAAPAVYSQVSS